MNKIMLKLSFLVIVVLFVVSVFACKQVASGNTPNTTAVLQFFDLKGYFTDEAHRLNVRPNATKIVTVNGKVEEKFIEDVDFTKELSFFLDSDINRPAWSDKYAIDTTFNEQHGVKQMAYKCLDDKLETRRIILDFEKGVVTNVLIESSTFNSIATFNQILSYKPDIGYSIESLQKMTFGEDSYFKIEVRI